MSTLPYRGSRPDGWSLPHPYTDATMRRMKHGPLQPMEQPGIFARLFRLR